MQVLESPEVVEQSKLTEQQIISNKVMSDMSDSEKIKKDVLLMNVKELEEHKKFLHARNTELTNEYNLRKRLVDGINGSIAGAHAELHGLRTEFNKQNENLVNELKKKIEDVEKSDKTLQSLIRENIVLKEKNQKDSSLLSEELLRCRAEVYEMRKALDENLSMSNKKDIDIALREDVLKAEREAFEKEKESIAPDMARISSIKNENILLLQKIEAEKANNRNMKLSLDSERQTIEENRVFEQSKNKSYGQELANQEAKLRKWEEELKDYDLEIRARAAETDKMLRRIQLEKKASDK